MCIRDSFWKLLGEGQDFHPGGTAWSLFCPTEIHWRPETSPNCFYQLARERTGYRNIGNEYFWGSSELPGLFLYHGCLTDFTWFQRFHVLQVPSQENELRDCNPLPRSLVSMRESMEMIDFKNRLFQFQEIHLPERKQVLLTVLLILLFCLLLYNGLFRSRWEK